MSRIQAGADIEKLHAQTSSRAVRRSDDMLRVGNMDTTKEHERMIQSTQRKMLRLIIQTKRRYKKIVKQKIKTNEENDTNDSSSTGEESEDGQSSNTHNDQDSDVSFENDTEEEIDTTEIEEEDWIDYIEKKHKRRLRKMGNAKIQCWNKTHVK